MLSPLLVVDNRPGVRDSSFSSTPKDGGLEQVPDNLTPEILFVSSCPKDISVASFSNPDDVLDVVNFTRSSSFCKKSSSILFISSLTTGDSGLGGSVDGGGILVGLLVGAS